MNNKTLFIILAALLAIYIFSQIGGKKENRSFKADIISIDTSKVSKIIFTAKNTLDEILLQKQNDSWILSQGDQTLACDPESIRNLLAQVIDVKAKRLAATKEDKWLKYEVDEKNGTPIKFFYGDQLASEFIVGRFNVNQQRQTMESFIRLKDGPRVYATDSYLPLALLNGIDGFRNKTIVDLDPSQIKGIEYSNGTAVQDLAFQAGKWIKNGVEMDSTKVANWVAKISNFKGTQFLKDTELLSSAKPIKSITIKGIENTSVDLFLNPGEGKKFVIKSSSNNSAYFQSDSTGIYKSIFEDLESVIK